MPRVDFISYKTLFLSFKSQKNVNVKIKVGIIVAINQLFKLAESCIKCYIQIKSVPLK